MATVLPDAIEAIRPQIAAQGIDRLKPHVRPAAAHDDAPASVIEAVSQEPCNPSAPVIRSPVDLDHADAPLHPAPAHMSQHGIDGIPGLELVGQLGAVLDYLSVSRGHVSSSRLTG